MNKRGINLTLQMKIRRYIEFMHQEEIFGCFRGDSLVGSLSNPLKEELMIDSYQRFLRKNEVLNHFSDEFINSLSQIVREITFAPDEIIYKVNY